MAIFDAKLMHVSLRVMCEEGEDYSYPVYGGVGKIHKWSTSPTNNLYGFAAVTNRQRLLIAGFSMLGVPMGSRIIPFKNIKSVQINKTIFGQNSVKMVIEDCGQELKLNCTIADHVYAMGIPDQKKNLEGLLDILQNRKKYITPVENKTQVQQTRQAQQTRKGPDYVAMLNREKQYALSLCDRLEARYGKAEFGAPLAEEVMTQWEAENQITIPEDLKEWLKFAGESKFKGGVSFKVHFRFL